MLRRENLKKLVHGTSLVAGLGLFIYLLWNLWQQGAPLWERIVELPWFYFPVALMLYGLGILLIAIAWVGAIRWRHAGLAWRKGLIIYALAGIGKYVPGNIAQHVGRVALTKKAGVSLSISSRSILIEFLLASMAAVILSAPVFFYDDRVASFLPQSRSLLGGIGVLAAAGLVVAFALRSQAIKSKFDRRTLTARDFKWAGSGLVTMTFGFIFLSVLNGWMGCMFMAQGDGPRLETFAHFAMAFPVAWLLGFFTPGAPAGFGTREFVLVTLLGPQYGESSVTIAALLLRFVSTMGDVLIFVSGYLMKKRYP